MVKRWRKSVQSIIDDLINMLDFQNMSDIAVSDLLSGIVSALSKVKPESKQKQSGETRPVFIAYLLSNGYPF